MWGGNHTFKIQSAFRSPARGELSKHKADFVVKLLVRRKPSGDEINKAGYKKHHKVVGLCVWSVMLICAK